MPNSQKNSNHPAKRKKTKPVAKGNSAGKTNSVSGSLVMCEVKLEAGEWVSPDSCKTFYIDENGKFPDITYEIQTDQAGPYEWLWDIKWIVLACSQKSGKKRFTPKHSKTFSKSGSFSSASKKWKADLNSQSIGGELTVKVKAGTTTFVRKTLIRGKEPGETRVNAELDTYLSKYENEVGIAKKIFHQESRFRQFYSDEQPLVSFDNGYGLGQATDPIPTYEQTWNWKEHVKYIVTDVIKRKRAAAKIYLDTHGCYTDDHLNTETLVYYNGANFHYYIWDSMQNKWIVNDKVLCDPAQSNTGWNVNKEENKDKTLEKLRAGEGTKPVYTGRCYAEHIKNNQ